MSLPGVEQVHEDARSAANGQRLTLSRVFLVGELTGGNGPLRIRSLRDLQRQCGARTADTAAMHDWVDGYFRRKGADCYVAPLQGPAAAKADVDLNDGAAAVALTVTAKSAGTDGNRTSVDIDVSGSDFTVKVYRDDALAEVSPSLADGAAAAAWSVSSRWVDIADGVGGDPSATASPADLTGGDDDFDGITDTEITAALDSFSKELGPGSVVLPGRTATAAQLLAATHAAANNRLARIDGEATDLVANLTSQATTVRAGGNGDYCDLIAPRVEERGLSSSTARHAPGSVVRCAAEARNDRAGVSPNQPAAGRWGLDPVGSKPEFTWDDSDLEDLNDAGVNVIRVVDNELKVYGQRTLADPATESVALSLGSARLRMAISEICRSEAAEEVFSEYDQRGVKLNKLSERCRKRILNWGGSLWFLEVTAEIQEDELQAGVFFVEIVAEFQASPVAERVRVVISRQATELG